MLEESTPLIGCAGWSIASAQKASFPLAGSHLERYGAVLPAVEINSSFYRSHRPETYQRWGDSVPENFRFSVKVPRTITHHQRLQNVAPLIEGFVQEVHELGNKLGCLLVQLPPSLRFDPPTVHAFFANLTQQTSAPVVCEARHRSWFMPAANQLLQEFGISQVIADPPVAPCEELFTGAKTVYVRLHGSPEMYHSAYSEEYLSQLENELRQYQAQGKTAWCIFDNTASGAAMPNALSLLARFKRKNAADVKVRA
ncbi:uncharacterized protein YecE (DUF72 family) [Paucimonas lemoignei]|uniref:Uncharacterized protein YecE (DUF72 family) n=1 Tax=Paucimonas lemoignei TaxID=29443 RepID=A0A4R3HRN1_PAULE|nr:DUF72 domain-containing protein [Paucimonas lemoignei]TCS32768.1 uncharacterized protein YecE (DUF72 family) [Paucimonas lemoignei]